MAWRSDGGILTGAPENTVFAPGTRIFGGLIWRGQKCGFWGPGTLAAARPAWPSALARARNAVLGPIPRGPLGGLIGGLIWRPQKRGSYRPRPRTAVVARARAPLRVAGILPALLRDGNSPCDTNLVLGTGNRQPSTPRPDWQLLSRHGFTRIPCWELGTVNRSPTVEERP